MKRTIFLAVVLAAGLVACTGEQPHQQATLVLKNAHVYTMDEAQPRAQAIAVVGDRIAAVGSDAEIGDWIGPDTQVLDAASRFVLPGFIEGHGHFMMLGESLAHLDLSSAPNWDAIVERVRTAARKAEPGQWILGFGWHQEKWDSTPPDNVGGMPVNAALNAAAPNNPVMLAHASAHGVIANAAALAMARVDEATAIPAGGEIAHDASGAVTGWLADSAEELVRSAYEAAQATRSAEQQRKDFESQVQLAGAEALAHGVTTFHDAGVPFATIDRYRELAAEGQLPLRLYVMVGHESNAALAENLARYRTIGAYGNFLTVRAIKRMVDGALGSRTAWLLQPYSDAPESTGLVVDSLAMIEDTARLALANDYQLNTHAIGDRANREILDLYQRAWNGRSDTQALRWRIEHAQHLHPDDVPRFGKLGVIASMQGVHATSDGLWVPQRLGNPRAGERTYVWRALWDSGAVLTNGTDVPVERIDPIASFYASVTRRLADGSRFFPEQCLTRVEALRSYTLNNAYAAFEEQLKGSVSVGKLADIVVLSQDVLTVPEESLLETRVESTILGGKLVYQRGSD